MPNLHHEKLIGYLQVIKFIGIPDMSCCRVLQLHCLKSARKVKEIINEELKKTKNILLATVSKAGGNYLWVSYCLDGKRENSPRGDCV